MSPLDRDQKVLMKREPLRLRFPRLCRVCHLSIVMPKELSDIIVKFHRRQMLSYAATASHTKLCQGLSVLKLDQGQDVTYRHQKGLLLPNPLLIFYALWNPPLGSKIFCIRAKDFS
jgi:hypothetical protein